MAQLCARPGATAVKRRSAPTAAGVEIRLLAPVPSCPWSLPPQQNARPSAPTRQVCRPPATMLTLERLGGGPMAEATEIDRGTAGAGLAVTVEAGEFLGGVLETGGVTAGVGSSTTPT